MRQDVVDEMLKTLKEKYIGKKIVSVVYDKEVEEFLLILEDGTEIIF